MLARGICIKDHSFDGVQVQRLGLAWTLLVQLQQPRQGLWSHSRGSMPQGCGVRLLDPCTARHFMTWGVLLMYQPACANQRTLREAQQRAALILESRTPRRNEVSSQPIWHVEGWHAACVNLWLSHHGRVAWPPDPCSPLRRGRSKAKVDFALQMDLPCASQYADAVVTLWYEL